MTSPVSLALYAMQILDGEIDLSKETNLQLNVADFFFSSAIVGRLMVPHLD